MKELERPHLPHVPTLTEVIEVPPAFILDGHTEPAALQMSALESRAMTASPTMPVMGQDWTPLKNLILPTLPEADAVSALPGDMPVDLADVPVLSDAVAVAAPELVAEVAEPVLTEEVTPAAPEAREARPEQAQPLMQPELPSDEQIAQRVMVDVQRRIDSMLEFRLREALAPILARHTESLIREMRDELSNTMRDVVTRSVSQELAKLRQR